MGNAEQVPENRPREMQGTEGLAKMSHLVAPLSGIE
jgi:hypothetical protein